jgi:putative oxidoreductase
MKTETRVADYGATLLRTSLGVLFLAHGLLLKVMTYSMAGTVGYFESIGLNAFIAYLVTYGEILGGIALIAGVMTRWASLGLAIISFGAIMPHAANGWAFSSQGGGWEFPLFLGIVCLVQAAIGPGAFRFKTAQA